MAEITSFLKVLISSKQAEFSAERASIREIMRPMPLLAADAAEEWPPGSMSPETKSVAAAATCAIYVGLFGCTYSEPTVQEFKAAARNPHREIVIYIKRCERRDPRLADFLEGVVGAKTGHTVMSYADWEEVRGIVSRHLWAAVQRMIERLLCLGDPPKAMGSGDTLLRKWNADKAALRELGLPDDPRAARNLAEDLRRAAQHQQRHDA